MKETGNGNCFEVSAHLVIGRTQWAEGDTKTDAERGTEALAECGAKNLKLVHGFVSRPVDGFRHPHAWVEADIGQMRFCFDYSNGKSSVTIREVYYAAGEIETVKRYNFDQTAEKLVGEENYGPWEID